MQYTLNMYDIVQYMYVRYCYLPLVFLFQPKASATSTKNNCDDTQIFDQVRKIPRVFLKLTFLLNELYFIFMYAF